MYLKGRVSHNPIGLWRLGTTLRETRPNHSLFKYCCVGHNTREPKNRSPVSRLQIPTESQ